MRIKTYESWKSEEVKTKELVEDLFQPIYDKWKVKKIPSNSVAGDFMTRVQDMSIYYHIGDSVGVDGIIFKIYQNRFPSTNNEVFSELIKDCIKILDRLKKFDLRYDINFDASVIQNPYNWGMMNTFILKLKKL